MTRRLAPGPLGWRRTTLLVTVRRYRCIGCEHVWRQDTSKAAEPRAKLSRRRCAGRRRPGGPAPHGRSDCRGFPQRFDGVVVIGVDEHVWRHTRRGDNVVTFIIDVTPIRAGTGPHGCWTWCRSGEKRSKQAFKAWLAARPQAWRDGVAVFAMDGFPPVARR